MRTSMAMKKYVEENRPQDVVRVVDTLEYVGHLYNKTVSEGYEIIAKNAPNIYGMMYNHTNKASKMTKFAKKFNKVLSRNLLPLMVEFRPDIIICVQAFCVNMACSLKKKYKMDIPVITLITDFAPHIMYVQDGVDRYVVSNKEMVYAMERYGVDTNIIQVSGIPIDPVFYNRYDKAELMKKMGLNPNLLTLLFMAGSFGVKDVFKVYRDIVETETDFQVIVITGRNKKLFEEFSSMLDKSAEEYEAKLKSGKYDDSIPEEDENITENREANKFYAGKCGIKPTKLLYFVDNVNEYMYIADLIITKPGGLTVSEAIASQLPMAIFSAFPGQEEDNANYLERSGMAIRLPKKNSGKVVHNLLMRPERLEDMKESCRANYKENSAEKIMILAEELVNQYASKDDNNRINIDEETLSRILSESEFELELENIDDSLEEQDEN